MSGTRSLSTSSHGLGMRLEGELDLEDVAEQAHAADRRRRRDSSFSLALHSTMLSSASRTRSERTCAPKQPATW